MLLVALQQLLIRKDNKRKLSFTTRTTFIKFSGINFENLYSGVDAKSSVRMSGFGEQATRNVLILINGFEYLI